MTCYRPFSNVLVVLQFCQQDFLDRNLKPYSLLPCTHNDSSFLDLIDPAGEFREYPRVPRSSQLCFSVLVGRDKESVAELEQRTRRLSGGASCATIFGRQMHFPHLEAMSAHVHP